MLGGSTCPSCEMPFDKGKKRRLIDSCGHERCYSCLFRSEACPLCLRADFNDEDGLEGPFREGFTGSSGPMSILAPTDGWIDESSTVNSLCGSPRPRTKVTTRANIPTRVIHVSASSSVLFESGRVTLSCILDALPEPLRSVGMPRSFAGYCSPFLSPRSADCVRVILGTQGERQLECLESTFRHAFSATFLFFPFDPSDDASAAGKVFRKDRN